MNVNADNMSQFILCAVVSENEQKVHRTCVAIVRVLRLAGTRWGPWTTILYCLVVDG